MLKRYFLVIVSCLTVLSCSKSDDSDTIEFVNEISVADEILRLVNEHRQGLGLSALAKNQTAENLAVDHTNYMISKDQISHDHLSSRGEELSSKENATAVAENVASSYPTAAAVFEGWLNSSGHRTNIEGNYTHIGIAAIKNGQGKYFYTQLFYR
ncbi:CAP domain-containing protein [Aquimarina sp. 2201CG5-10]|uniref:CAP domain-containing protein n=1 Tax=Aquimarina callyspongiae TaxID=3098150 RepID=UPI002AB47B1C|nr:CAP domain-containing protein [Aquimarina sp. 2201CG5-10]MDY8138787.1 CAP domain-containing protein [Aquimarina sp. 2201CG5-10]